MTLDDLFCEDSPLPDPQGAESQPRMLGGLRRLRTDRGLSQKNLAFFSGVSERKISSLENGVVGRLQDLASMAAVLKLPVSGLFLAGEPSGDYTLRLIGELLGVGPEPSVVVARIEAGPLEVRHAQHLGVKAKLSDLTLRHVLRVSASTYRDRLRQNTLKASESDALLDAAELIVLLGLRSPGVPIENLLREEGFYLGRWHQPGGRFLTLLRLQVMP